MRPPLLRCLDIDYSHAKVEKMNVLFLYPEFVASRIARTDSAEGS